MDGQRRRCLAITSGGKQCPIAPPAGQSYCLHHDPDRTEESQEARRRGGLGKARTTRARKLLKGGAESLDDLYGILREAIVDCLAGTLPPAQLNAISTAVGQASRLSLALEYASDIQTLRQELTRLREQIDAQRRSHDRSA